VMILVLGAHPNINLEVRRLFRSHLAEVRNLKIFKKFDREWIFLYRVRIPIPEVEVGPYGDLILARKIWCQSE